MGQKLKEKMKGQQRERDYSKELVNKRHSKGKSERGKDVESKEERQRLWVV